MRSKLGVVGPFTGPRSTYGDMLRQLVLQSELPDYADLIWGDDQGLPTLGKQIASSLLKDEPIAVLGHFNSDSAQAAAEIYAVNQIPLLLPAATSPRLSNRPGVYQFCPSDQKQVEAIAHFLSSHHHKKGYIWTDKSAYGHRLNALLIEQSCFPFEKISEKSIINEDDLIVLLGAHHAVADYLISLKQQLPGLMALCCDDCAIPEFYQWVQDFQHIWIATPHPTFSICTQLAINKLLAYLKGSQNESFNEWAKINELAQFGDQFESPHFKMIHFKL